MAHTTPVSTPIEALLEQLGAAITGAAPSPTPAALYAQLLRIRDEAVLVEVRASARDAKVRELLAELATAADRLEALDANALSNATNSLPTPVWCGLDLAETDEAMVQRRWDAITRDFHNRRAALVASQGDQS